LKKDNKAARAVIFLSEVYSQKLPHDTAIYTAELLEIRVALHYVKNILSFELLCTNGGKKCNSICAVSQRNR